MLNLLDLVALSSLMEGTSGTSEVRIGLVDGPVAIEHPDLTSENVRQIPGSNGAACSKANSAACMHGTFVAGILSAKRGSPAPAICPGCTLIIRPIFAEITSATKKCRGATQGELAEAIGDCIDAGARVVNLRSSPRAAVEQRRAGAGRGADSRRQAGRDRGRGGG